MQAKPFLLSFLTTDQSESFQEPTLPTFVRLDLDSELMAMDPSTLAEVFLHVSFLRSALSFLKEKYWLEEKHAPSRAINFNLFIDQIFESELIPIDFLKEFFTTSSVIKAKTLTIRALEIEKKTITQIRKRAQIDRQIFATVALEQMKILYSFESALQAENKRLGQWLGISLYHSFDRLDEVLGLNYNSDRGMCTDLQINERLYEGAGVGVQSGYSTVLTALQMINPAVNSRFIDLGSGYGRVGMIVGLLRPDIDFSGYELVKHRVQSSISSCENFGMSQHVHFYTQDLSQRSFQIPDAEVYYVYDPFSATTYSHVLSQLIAISRRQKIVVATKGNARSWLVEVAQKESWPPQREFDEGNLCLFESASL